MHSDHSATSEGACSREEKREQPVALKQQDTLELTLWIKRPWLIFLHSFCEILLLSSHFTVLMWVCLKCSGVQFRYNFKYFQKHKEWPCMRVVSGRRGYHSRMVAFFFSIMLFASTQQCRGKSFKRQRLKTYVSNQLMKVRRFCCVRQTCHQPELVNADDKTFEICLSNTNSFDRT